MYLKLKYTFKYRVEVEHISILQLRYGETVLCTYPAMRLAVCRVK